MKTFEEYQFRIKHNQLSKGYKYSPNTKEELIDAIEAEIKLQGLKANLNCIDTSDIADMSSLFDAVEHEYARNFNGDISKWNVSNVKNMSCMFAGTKSFNQDISEWDVSNVENMSYMFDSAKSFNQDISKWNVDNTWNTEYIFDGCPIKEEYKPKFD